MLCDRTKRAGRPSTRGTGQQDCRWIARLRRKVAQPFPGLRQATVFLSVSLQVVLFLPATCLDTAHLPGEGAPDRCPRTEPHPGAGILRRTQIRRTPLTTIPIPLFEVKQKLSQDGRREEILRSSSIAAIWLIIVTFFMVLNRTLDLEVYFVLSLIGLLVVAVLIDGAFSRPRYMRYLGYVIAVGVALFAYIVVEKILEIIAA